MAIYWVMSPDLDSGGVDGPIMKGGAISDQDKRYPGFFVKNNASVLLEEPPNWHEIPLYRNAVVTDYILDSFALDLWGFCCSNRMYELLKEYRLPPHKFYPMHLRSTKGELHSCGFVHLAESADDNVDFSQSEFEIHNIYTEQFVSRKFASKEELYSARFSKQALDEYRIGKVYFKNEIGYDLFRMRLVGWPVFVSDRLKQALAAAGMTGMKFSSTGEKYVFV